MTVSTLPPVPTATDEGWAQLTFINPLGCREGPKGAGTGANAQFLPLSEPMTDRGYLGVNGILIRSALNCRLLEDPVVPGDTASGLVTKQPSGFTTSQQSMQ